MKESAVISQQIGVVGLFILVFLYSVNETISLPSLLFIDLCTALFYLFLIYFIQSNKQQKKATTEKSIDYFTKITNLGDQLGLSDSVLCPLNIKRFLLLFGASWGLSPVLKTLTSPTSDDTITALTVLCLLLHLLLNDYDFNFNNDPNQQLFDPDDDSPMASNSVVSNTPFSSNDNSNTLDADKTHQQDDADSNSTNSTSDSNDLANGLQNNFRITAPASVNAAIFASVLLGSRLPSATHMFGLLVLAIELFVFSPYIRFPMKALYPKVFVYVTVLISVMVTVLLYPLSRALAILYAMWIVFISFVCPFWLIWIQKYKK